MTVHGLTETFAAMWDEGWGVSVAAVQEIMRRLEAGRNYIPSSDLVRREYGQLLLEEYRSYAAGRGRAGRRET